MATQQQHMVETVHKKAMIILLMAISPELNLLNLRFSEWKKKKKEWIVLEKHVGKSCSERTGEGFIGNNGWISYSRMSRLSVYKVGVPGKELTRGIFATSWTIEGSRGWEIIGLGVRSRKLEGMRGKFEKWTKEVENNKLRFQMILHYGEPSCIFK